MKKYPNNKIWFIFIIILLISCSNAHFEYCFEEIDPFKDPIQIDLENDIRENITFVKTNAVIHFLAEYDISARVVSRKNYYERIWGNISPVDLALVWGDLVKSSNDKNIKYSQSGRWYHYRYTEYSSYDESYISPHSSNNHMIPANKNIRAALKKFKKNDIIRIVGYLVNVKVDHKGEALYWRTSRTRRDTGAGACEIIFVESVQIGEKIYK